MTNEQINEEVPTEKKVLVNKKETKGNVIHDNIFQVANVQGRYMIAVMDKIVTKKSFETQEEAIEYIDSKPWELIINVTCLISEETQKIRR